VTTADVLVVGGGVHGASATWHLARRGVDVLLVERGELAGGPTGRSSAVCRAYYTDPFLARVARASLDLLATFPEHTGGRDAGFHRTGGLFLHGPDDAEVVVHTAAALTAIGTTTDLLRPADLAERFPRLALDGVACAAYEHDAGHADPVRTTTAMVAHAREHGARVRLRAEVVAIEPRPGTDRGVTVALADGTRISAGRVLLAAGPWTGRLAAMAGASLPLTVERHVVATFATAGARHLDLDVVLADVPNGYYAKPEAGGGFLAGPLTPAPPIADPDAVDPRIHDDEVAALGEALVRRVPDLAAAQPRGGWASLYDVSPDWQPVIGEVAPGVVVDAGTSGHGFKLAPALGGHVAALVLGEADPGLAAFHPDRFTRADGALAAGYGEARILG
jgi:sarcosine oxidase, subunit beta